MNYSLITEEQLNKRFRAAPEKIKELLESEKVQTEVARICEANHLDMERALIVSQLTGLVLLGFVPERMVSLELGEQAHLNFLHSNAIAKELSEKIFTPVADELKAVYKPISDNTNENDTNIRMDTNDTNKEEKDEMEIGINKETAEMIDARIRGGEEEKEGGVDNWIKKLKKDEDQPILLYEEKAPEAKGKEFTRFSLPFGLFAKKTAAPVIPLRAEIESGEGVRRTIGEIVGRDQESRKIERLKDATQITRIHANKEEKGGIVERLKGREKRVVHYSGARTPILAYDDDLFGDEESRKVEGLKGEEEKESRKVEGLKNITPTTRTDANNANKNEEEAEKKEDGKNGFKGKIEKPRPMMLGNTIYLK